jgi:hypothetical protein
MKRDERFPFRLPWLGLTLYPDLTDRWSGAVHSVTERPTIWIRGYRLGFEDSMCLEASTNVLRVRGVSFPALEDAWDSLMREVSLWSPRLYREIEILQQAEAERKKRAGELEEETVVL